MNVLVTVLANLRARFIYKCIATAFSLGSIALLFAVDWRVGLGVLLALWAQNILAAQSGKTS